MKAEGHAGGTLSGVLFDLLRVSELEMAEESMATSESVDIAFLYR